MTSLTAYARFRVSPLFRDASLAFDGMIIRSGVRYDQSADEIVGLEDVGCEATKGPNFADSLVVFMLRGVGANWKQPIGYFTVKHGLGSAALREILIRGLCAAHLAGVRVGPVLTFCSCVVFSRNAHS